MRYDEVVIKVDVVELIEIIKGREPEFDDETAELFISCYVENISDVSHDYPYSTFLNNTTLIENEEELIKELKERGYEGWRDYNKDRKKYGDELTYEKITKGKNKGKILRIDGLRN